MSRLSNVRLLAAGLRGEVAPLKWMLATLSIGMLALLFRSFLAG